MDTTQQQNRDLGIGHSILLVDDDAVMRFMNREILLQIFPFAMVWEAKSGYEAIAICCQKKPDVILMDVQMPLMDGYETTRRLRESPDLRGIPIVALTAGILQTEHERCIDAGMDDVILKPIDNLKLKTAVEGQINKGRR